MDFDIKPLFILRFTSLGIAAIHNGYFLQQKLKTDHDLLAQLWDQNRQALLFADRDDGLAVDSARPSDSVVISP